MLSALDAVKMQLRAFLAEVDKVKGSEFPYEYSRQALEQVGELFRGYLDLVGTLVPDSPGPLVQLVCGATYPNLYKYLPILGFILRSTNVRNAFEVHGPILRMAQQIIGPSAKLILSSEWQFSPFTYKRLSELPDFVLIGLPVTESQNPFLVPLAGHELGHTVWSSQTHDKMYQAPIEQAIVKNIRDRWDEYSKIFPGIIESQLETDMFARQTWAFAFSLAIKQAQESFCDFLGLRVFGESYLHAHAYIDSPRQSGTRPIYYPNSLDRARQLLRAGTKFGLANPAEYLSQFVNIDNPFQNDKQSQFLLAVADAASGSIVDALIQRTDEIITQAGVETRETEAVKKCIGQYRLMVPAQRAGNLPNVLNAAWEALLEPNFFGDRVPSDKIVSFLAEIVLKTCEVLEIEQILREKA